MNPQQIQPPQPQVDPSQAGANLGFVNTMQQHLLQYQMANQPISPTQTPQNAPQPMQPKPTSQPAPEPKAPPAEPTEEPKDELKGVEERLSTQIDQLGKSLKDGQTQEMKKEMDEIKKTLKDLSA